MHTRLLRLLVLACSLPLALPPGWCCMAFCRAPAPGGDAAAPDVAPCCKHKQQETGPAAPTPAPKPAPCRHCPCAERTTTVPQDPRAYTPDLSRSALLAPPSVTPDAHA